MSAPLPNVGGAPLTAEWMRELCDEAAAHLSAHKGGSLHSRAEYVTAAFATRNEAIRVLFATIASRDAELRAARAAVEKARRLADAVQRRISEHPELMDGHWDELTELHAALEVIR